MITKRLSTLGLVAVSLAALSFCASAQDKTRVGGAALLNALIMSGSEPIALRKLVMPAPGTASKEIRFETAAVFDPALVGWVQEFFDQQTRRRPGRVKFANIVLKRGYFQSFSEGALTEVVLPGPNRGKTALAVLSARFNATLGGRSAVGAMTADPPTAAAKTWLPANFRFRMGDLPCSSIQSMSDLVLKAPFSGGTVATFLLPFADAKQWEAKLAPAPGATAPLAPIDAVLEYLGPDGKTRASLAFRMQRMSRLPTNATAANVPMVQAQVTIGMLKWKVGS